MNIKQQAKRKIRQLFLQSLRLAARPTLRFKAAPPVTSSPPNKLLLIRPDHLGDVLMTTPALALLRRAFPGSDITALVGPWGAASLQNNPDIDRIARCDFPGFSRQPKENVLAPYLYALQQSRELRGQNYDAVISFRYDFWWGALLAYLADIPVRIGYDWPEAKPFLTHRLASKWQEINLISPAYFKPFGQPATHSTALSLELARTALEIFGLDSRDFILNPETAQLKYFPSAEDRRYVNLHLSEWGINKGDKLIAIHPGGGATIKLWTAEGFAAVADNLNERYGAKVVLVAGEAEKGLVKNISQICKIEPLTLETSGGLGRLGALFERCDLVIGLDSGPLHLAVAAGAPTIHLFGPTDPGLYGPWGDPQKHRVVRTQLDLPCCPCGVLDFNRTCLRGGYCMRTIKVDQVLDIAGKMLY